MTATVAYSQSLLDQIIDLAIKFEINYVDLYWVDNTLYTQSISEFYDEFDQLSPADKVTLVFDANDGIHDAFAAAQEAADCLREYV